MKMLYKVIKDWKAVIDHTLKFPEHSDSCQSEWIAQDGFT